MPQSGRKSNSMDALKAALAARQAKAQTLIAESSAGEAKTWFKRSDLLRKEKEEYLELRRLDEERRKTDEEAYMKKVEIHLSTNSQNDDEGGEEKIPQHILDEALLADDDADPPVAKSEVLERLREIAQPITLFGETDMMRYRRYRQCEREIHEGKKNPDLVMLENVHMGQQMQALTNDLDEEEAEKDNEDEEKDADSSDGDNGGEKAEGADDDKSDSEDEGKGVADKSDSEDEGDAAEEAKRAAKMKEAKKQEEATCAVGKDLLGLTVPDIDLSMMDRCDFIRAWVRKALKIWEKELADKPDEEKKTAKVKTEVAAHRQVRRDVRPLQKRLRMYVLQEFLLDKINVIVKHAEQRDYRAASEAYLDLSIGKAAWPVGIGCGGSMLMEDAIGLHDKFNRMKNVKDNSTALNDDVTRKYVQAVKRLMNVAQRHWPPEDPSRAA